jgi:hypothetical protein
MDLYTFTVEDFIIHDTRALHNDTLTLSLSATIDGDVVASRLISLGDFDNGQYSTVDYVPSDHGPGLNEVVVNDPTAKVAFAFQLVNSSLPEGTLSARLVATADQLASITAGLAGAGATGIFSAGAEGGTAVIASPAFAAGLIMEGLATLWGWLDADCDGPVAVDQISGPRYVLDAWTDNSAHSLRTQCRYPGTATPHGCGANSDYEVIWSLQHSRVWVPVTDGDTRQLISETGVSAAEHFGAVHAFGVVAGGGVNHARTFTGAIWSVDALGPFNLGNLPVSAISFDDRLYLFGVQVDGSISSLAYTVDGSTWVPRAISPGAIDTAEPVATAVFRHRLYLFARESSSSQLRMTSTSDLHTWNPWADVPSPAMPPSSAVAAATLGDKLFIFGVFKTGKTPASTIMRNSTSDGAAWSGWDTVEGGARPEGAAADEPLDVSAANFDGRIYLASRWQSTNSELFLTNYMAVNFSEDGDNWSGWRIPDPGKYEASASAGLAAVGNHLYILAPQLDAANSQTTNVWAY